MRYREDNVREASKVLGWAKIYPRNAYLLAACVEVGQERIACQKLPALAVAAVFAPRRFLDVDLRSTRPKLIHCGVESAVVHAVYEAAEDPYYDAFLSCAFFSCQSSTYHVDGGNGAKCSRSYRPLWGMKAIMLTV